MPLYLDIHQVPGARTEDLRNAHMADMEVQKRHGVDFRKYWFNETMPHSSC